MKKLFALLALLIGVGLMGACSPAPFVVRESPNTDHEDAPALAPEYAEAGLKPAPPYGVVTDPYVRVVCTDSLGYRFETGAVEAAQYGLDCS